MFVTSSRLKTFSDAVVKFDEDGMIATVKTGTIRDEVYSVGSSVSVSWGYDKKKSDYTVEILFLSNAWLECKNFERDYESSKRSGIAKPQKVQRKGAKNSKKTKVLTTPKESKKKSNHAVTTGCFQPEFNSSPLNSKQIKPLSINELSMINYDSEENETGLAILQNEDTELISNNETGLAIIKNKETEPIPIAENEDSSKEKLNETDLEIIENQELYMRHLHESFTEKLDVIEGVKTTLPPHRPTITTIEDIWNYIYMVENRIDERLTIIEEKITNEKIEFAIEREKPVSPVSNVPAPASPIEESMESSFEITNVPVAIKDTLPGGSPSVKVNLTPRKPITSVDNSVIKRLAMDKKSVIKAKYAKPNLTLTAEQYRICHKVWRDACSMKNFAARLIMELFDHRELHMRNCHGRSGKAKISDKILETILYALHTYYADEMAEDPEKSWKNCTKAIDTRLRNGNGKSAKRYKGAKLEF